ncbi:MAG TPA: NAD+ synthase [Nitrospirales bacterium]|nr:NAD+ synthase [Nitrospirales bacterium]
MRVVRIALAQINTTVGDLDGNAALVLRGVEAARQARADLVAFPELTLTGYPPEDLLLRPQFIADNLRTLDRIVREVRGIVVVLGFVDRTDDIYNAAAFICDGRIAATQHKIYLPNYGVFDENRYFQAGARSSTVVLNGVTLGVNICEDIWYPEGPSLTQALVGDAEVILNISASPYHRGKLRFREEMLATRAMDNLVTVAYVNLVGGQDELVFDGNSLVVDQAGRTVARGRAFEEDLVIADVDVDAVNRARLHDTRRRRERRSLERQGVSVDRIVVSARYRHRRRRPIHDGVPTMPPPLEEVYRALVLGIGDYARKNGFKKAVLGLSGGIDSALTAVLAVDTLGPRNVAGVFMPSPYTSDESREDARALARNLGVRLLTLPITPVFQAYRSALAPAFKRRRPDTTEENLQARIRGNLLMALSNKFGWLVLTTGNKSEMSVGYATLYGDMAGGFAAIKDVPKTLVYELARWRNGRGPDPVIPKRMFVRPPTAELRPNQTDQDSLPPYDILDPIIRGYVEEDQGLADLLSAGFDRQTVERVLTLVDRSEYKRRQSPPGVKITPRALGKDRRMPITNRYRGW